MIKLNFKIIRVKKVFTIESKRLRSLRTNQYIHINIAIIIMFTFFYVLFNGISLNKIKMYLGIFIPLTLILERWFNRLKYLLFPYLEELDTYEKEKLGEEWNKMKKLNNIYMLIVGTVFILQGIKNYPVIRLEVSKITILGCFILIVLFNSSLFFHNRKVDKGNINSLKGYTRKRILFGIKIGLIFTISLFTIAFIILLREY